MLKICKYFKKQDWILLCCIVVFTVLHVFLDLKIPDYMSEITTLVKTQGSLDQLFHAGKFMLICALSSLILALFTRYLASWFGSKVAFQLRKEIFSHVESFSLAEMNQFTTASLITRSTNDVTQIQNFLTGGIQSLIKTPIIFILALLKISTKQWEWSLFTMCSVSLVIITLIFIINYAHPRIRKVQELTDDLNKVTREILTGIRVIRAYNAEEYEEDKFSNANHRLTQNSLEERRAMGLMNPVMKFVNNFLNIGIYCIGAYLIAQSGTQQQLILFSDMIVFSTYAAKIVQSFMSLNRIFMITPRATVSSARIMEVLETEPSIHDGAYTQGIDGEEGTIEFKNVSFSYPDSDVKTLDNISFKIHKNETFAIIGSTGSGKTTLIHLMNRFYDATEGEILVHGRNIKDYQCKALHKILGYASQKAVLFSGTIQENIGFGHSSIHQENVEEAIETAQASEFVKTKENGIDAMISRGGTNISGGQKQRLSIARTLYEPHDIYIFDDSFSALDFKTDKALRNALAEKTQKATTVLVAQRIGAIKDADQILVLHEGKIVGLGKHEELMKTCQIYQDIAYTQLSKEDLCHE